MGYLFCPNSCWNPVPNCHGIGGRVCGGNQGYMRLQGWSLVNGIGVLKSLEAPLHPPACQSCEHMWKAGSRGQEVRHWVCLTWTPPSAPLSNASSLSTARAKKYNKKISAQTGQLLTLLCVHICALFSHMNTCLHTHPHTEKDLYKNTNAAPQPRALTWTEQNLLYNPYQQLFQSSLQFFLPLIWDPIKDQCDTGDQIF